MNAEQVNKRQAQWMHSSRHLASSMQTPMGSGNLKWAVALTIDYSILIAFPELYDDFIGCLPFPDTMRLNGACNLAAHFPTNGLPPDAGE